MARYGIPGMQYSDSNGNPLSGGKLYFYEVSTTTPLTTYSDSGLTTPNANPIVLGADGYAPDIFFSGQARVIIKNSDDSETIDDADPVGSSLTSEAFATWDTNVTYTFNSLVTHNGLWYRSLVASNAGNNPSSTSGKWAQIFLIEEYDSTETYLASRVVTSNQALYTAIATTTGNDPQDSPTYWQPAAGANANFLINGDMRIAQRNTSFTTPNDEYTLDRWRVDTVSGGAGVSAVTQESFTVGAADVTPETEHYLKIDQTTALGSDNHLFLEQRIEGVRTLAGETVTLSFWARQVTSTVQFDIISRQNFGTGGSPSSNNDQEFTTAESFSSSWAKYSYTITLDTLASKTIGTGGDDYLAIAFRYPSGEALTTFDLRITNVKLERGSAATAFEPRPYADELNLCQRYFETSYSAGVAVGTASNPGAAAIHSDGAAQNARGPIVFASTKRDTPTLTIYNPNDGTSGEARNATDNTDHTATAANVGTAGFGGLSGITAAVDAWDIMRFHWTAEAEL